MAVPGAVLAHVARSLNLNIHTCKTILRIHRQTGRIKKMPKCIASLRKKWRGKVYGEDYMENVLMPQKPITPLLPKIIPLNSHVLNPLPPFDLDKAAMPYRLWKESQPKEEGPDFNFLGYTVKIANYSKLNPPVYVPIQCNPHPKIAVNQTGLPFSYSCFPNSCLGGYGA